MFSVLLSTVDWKHQKVKAKFLEIVLFKSLSHDFWVRDVVSGWLKLTILHSSVFSETMVKSRSALAMPAALSSIMC